MCGIAGFVTDPGLTPERALLKRMCDRIQHRGPDGEGYFTDERVALGHRRLSIIDVEGGAQPLGNEDGRYQIVFNGEIYNYRELMADLQSRGHRFRTHSDTEVIVHLYEELGPEAICKLVGMFAIAIWDQKDRTLLLARDRFGEKPLYYSLEVPGMKVLFASELKAMTLVPGFPSEVSAEAVAEFLNFSYVPDPDTIYRRVRKLAPAEWLLVDGEGKVRRETYWRPEFLGESAPDERASQERLDALARESVVGQMVSDVPLGGFLSGGVDSSAVVAYMAQSAPEHVKTFSIGFTSKEYDELKYARLVAEKYETDHSEETVTPEIDVILDKLVHHYDEPFGDSSAIPTLYLARMTRKHVTVALSGDGADELFGGYRRYSFALMEERARGLVPEWARRRIIRPVAHYYPKFDYMPRVFRAKSTLTGIASTFEEAYYRAMTRFGDEGLDAVLSGDLRRELNGYSSCARFCERFAPLQRLPKLAQLQAVDWQTYLPGDILVKVDRAAMAYSLESRAPFLNHRLAEFAASLPTNLKIRGTTGKVLFKRAVGVHLPERTVTRRKMGFAVPLPEWFRGSLKPLYEERVLNQRMSAFIDLAGARRLYEDHLSGMKEYSGKLWNLLMLACWQERHLA
ncbi:MAG: asparagine synthase (glutamine-hydrolyzing) [Acidobacteria bacterium]|nr:asparagine synthase (glutamine-hydrolyzing) [Acidobacteriota bacterium]